MAVESFLTAGLITFLISLILIFLTFWGFKTKIDIEKTSYMNVDLLLCPSAINI